MRHMTHLEVDNKEVDIYYDTQWEEYICKLFIDGEYQKNSDYHTDSYVDAMDTSSQMVGVK